MALTVKQAEKILREAYPGRWTAAERRQLARQLRSITKALPPGSGAMSALSGDLKVAADVLDPQA